MSNGDEAMSPAEFAKLMGAYPEPVGNPLPAYGGYMDNSPANFAWVNNNDYFGAELVKDTYHDDDWHEAGCHECLRTIETGEIVYVDRDGGQPPVCRDCYGDLELWRNADTDLTPTNHMNNSIGQVVPITNPMELPTNLIETEAGGGPEGQITPDVFSAPLGGMIPDANPDVQWTIDPHDPQGGWLAVPLGWTPPQQSQPAPTPTPTPPTEGESGNGESTPAPQPQPEEGNGGGDEGQQTQEQEQEQEGHQPPPHEDQQQQDSVSASAETFEAPSEWPPAARHIITGIPKADREAYDEYRCGPVYYIDGEWSWCNKGSGRHGHIDGGGSDAPLCGYCGMDMETQSFNAPYGGLGAIMDIGKSTPLADFTDEELTTSSAIHGDFDQASLNYSGHQNLEVRAESEEELYDCFSCGEPAVSLTLDQCLDCGQQYNAEFEDLTENLVEVVNVLGEGVARIRIEDTEYDEDENIVTEDVDIEITDMDGNTLHQQTLDDSWSPYDDRDDYLESEMVETAKKHPIALLLGGLFGATVILKPEVFQPVTNTISSVFESVKSNFNSDTQEVLENDPELVENPDTGDLDPAQYEELVVESTGLAVDVIPMSLDPSFMGSRFQALPTERYVEYNDPGIGAHTDIAMNRDEKFLEPEMAMVQAAEEGNVVKEAQAPGQSPYMSVDGQEPKDFNYRVIHETSPISLDPAVKPFIPQSMAGYTGNANTPPSVLNKMFNIGVLGQTPLFVAGQGDIGSSHTGSRNALPNSLGIAGSVGGPLSDKVNANYTDGTTSMSLAQWAIENTVSQSSDTEAIVIDRSSGAMKRVRRV